MADTYQYPTPAMIAATAAANMGAGGAPLTNGAPVPGGFMGAVTAPIARGMRGLRQWLGYTILGADGGQVFMPPQQPLQPFAQGGAMGAVGRQFDYPVGYNTRVSPRQGYIGFPMLKNLADGFDVLRIVIERLKDKICTQQWQIAPKDTKQERDARCDEVEDFFAYPDRDHCFSDWLRMLLEQAIVYDAVSIWLWPTQGGDLYSAALLDGSMISPKIMADGRAPPPELGPAYQQVIKGIGAVDYVRPVAKGRPIPQNADGEPMPELLYRPRNPRVESPYGFGPVEQIITTVNIALRREAYMLSYYTEGTTPDLIIQAPATWSAAQIAQFQLWWESVLSGNLAKRRAGVMVPFGVQPYDTKEKALTDETDQWLIRIICFAFGMNPMPFIKQMNKGQEKTHHDEAAQEGQEPWMQFVRAVVTYITATKFGYDDLEFRFKEDEAVDPLEQAQIDSLLVNAKLYHPDELRARRGDDAMSPDMREQMDMATFSATVNATVLPPDQQAESDARAQDAADAAAASAAAAKPKPGAGGPGGAVGKGQRPSRRSTGNGARY